MFYIFTPNFGENSHFDEHIFPPTKFCCKHHPVLSQPFHTPRKSPPNRKNHPSVSWFYPSSYRHMTCRKPGGCGTLEHWNETKHAISMQGGQLVVIKVVIKGTFFYHGLHKWVTSYISGVCSPYLKTAYKGAHLVAGGNGKEGFVAWHLKSQTITGNSLELLETDGFAVSHILVRCLVSPLWWKICCGKSMEIIYLVKPHSDFVEWGVLLNEELVERFATNALNTTNYSHVSWDF